MKSPKPVDPVNRGRWAWAPVIVAAATVTGAFMGYPAPAASAAGSNPPASAQHAGTAQSATLDSASITSPGSIGVRLLDVPADAVNNPRARAYIVDNLAPGTTIHRRIMVSNTTTSAQKVAVYAAAADITGGSFVGAAAHTANDLSTWTTLRRSSLDIPAGSTAVDTVTVAIPSTASPGERYALVWASVSNAQDAGNIELVNRVGIRMYVYVGGNNPATSFTVKSLTGQRNSAGRPLVRAEVHNTGGRAVDLSGTLTLSSVTGELSAGPYTAQLGATLAPGQSEPVWFVLPGQMASGPWNASVTLQSGLNKQAFRAQITFPRAGVAPSPAALPASGGFGILPILASAILIVLLAALAVWIIARRRRGNHANRSGTQAVLTATSRGAPPW
jgi:hypothetical protein